jgi:hypothetical protein
VCLDYTGANGLHRHPSRKVSEKVAKSSDRFDLFGDLGPGVAKRCPRGAEGVPLGCPSGAPGCRSGALGVAKGSPWVPQGCQTYKMGPSKNVFSCFLGIPAPVGAKGVQGGPKVTKMPFRRVPKESQRHFKWHHKNKKICERAHP